MKIKGAIFDFDGTLFDSMFIWDTAGESYLTSVGVTPRQGVNEAVCALSLSQTASYFKREYALPMTTEQIENGINRMVEHFYYDEVQPKDGMRELVEALRAQGAKCVIATATDRHLIEAALRRCSMERYFDGIFTCTEVGHGKDEPDIFRACLKALGTDRDNTVVFEDALHAAATAKCDGFAVVGVYDKSERHRSEMKALCDCYITDPVHPDELRRFASD